MRLLNLTVNDLGLFRGRHDFDLTPAHGPASARRNVVIVRGRNGVGKSTLFQAISLALHGSLALGTRPSRQEYNDFLLKRIHRVNGEDSVLVSNQASIELSFEYVLAGKPLRVQVERVFERKGVNVSETLNLLCDGNPPDVDSSDYQTWLDDLVPSRISDLCFFDAERLEALSDNDRSSASLADVLNRLLGLDLVERLQRDLEQYTLTKGGGKRLLGKLRARVIECQTTVDGLVAQLVELKRVAEVPALERATLEAELAEQEARLAAEGGAYAIRRPLQQERLINLKLEMDELETKLRDMSGELLPFALVPELCSSLSNRLVQESAARSHQASDLVWQKAVADLKKSLEGAEFYHGLKVPVKDRKTLAARVSRVLKKSGLRHSPIKQEVVHNLSEPESEKLRSWIVNATEVVPQQLKSVRERLSALQKERRKIESDLKRAPDDATLAPIYLEITQRQNAIDHLRRRETALSEEAGALQFKIDDSTRALHRAADELHKAQFSQKQLSLAERSIASLRTYKDALRRQKLSDLAKALVVSFNTLCRKEHLLEDVNISPSDFKFELRSAAGRVLGLSEFSAGERQLYALALLWALRQVSGKQLPLAIDTPLARLDDVHRGRLIHDYVPAVSDQVLLFATDVEIDADLAVEIEPYTARSYHLSYSESDDETRVSCSASMPDQLGGIEDYLLSPSQLIVPTGRALEEEPVFDA